MEKLIYVNPEKVYDIHSHINPQRIGAESLRNIMGYHFITTEMYSIGAPSGFFGEKISDAEWLKVAIDYLPRIKNTSSYAMAKIILQDLYDLDIDELNISNWVEFDKKIKSKYKDLLWPIKIIKEYCKIEKLMTAIDYPSNIKNLPGSDIFRREEESLSDFGGCEDVDVLRFIKPALKKKKITADDIRNFIRRRIDDCVKKGVIAFGFWMGRFRYEDISEDNLNNTLKDGDSDEEIRRKVSLFQLKEIFEYVKDMKNPPVLRFLIGAHSTGGSYKDWPARIFDMVSSDIFCTYQKLFDRYPDIKINIIVSNSARSREIDTFARFCPKITVSGTWLHTMYPNQITRIFSDRFEFLPAEKIIAFFSDAYNAEWVYGKLALTERCLEKVIEEKVKEGWWDKKFAGSIADVIFWENPNRVYGE